MHDGLNLTVYMVIYSSIISVSTVLAHQKPISVFSMDWTARIDIWTIPVEEMRCFSDWSCVGTGIHALSVSSSIYQ